MNQLNQTYPFSLLPLPYSMDSLSPGISSQTLFFHHQKHLKSYVDQLNEALEPYPFYHTWTLRSLLAHFVMLPSDLKQSIRQNAGGVANHDLYFSTLKPSVNPEPSSNHICSYDCPCCTFSTPHEFYIRFRQTFHSREEFKLEFKQKSRSLFGSGYTWLVENCHKNLSIVTTHNQDNPISFGLNPLLCIDVWEHAYYLDYQNRRNDYIDMWFEQINWLEVAKNWGRY